MSGLHDSGDHEGRDFVPLDQLRQKSSWRPSVDQEALRSLGGHLEAFAAELNDEERAALAAVLKMSPRDPRLVALAAERAEGILDPDEIRVFNRLLERPAPTKTQLEPALVLIMKGTRYCNLRCTYCGTWRGGPNQRMPFEVLAETIHGALSAPEVRQVEFFWHGGEPTLLPVSFYRKALWLQQQFRRPGQTVANTLQTNGTRLTPEWLDFLKSYRFRVEVSLDGPPEIHDRFRVDVAGKATSQRVRNGIAKLREYGFDPAAIMVVGEDVMALGPQRLLSYFLEIGVTDVGVLNLVPEGEHRGNAPDQRYFEFSRYVEFLRQLFHLWWPDHAERIAFREISDLMRRIRGEQTGLCLYNENCMGNVLTIEASGDVTACDKYQSDPAYRFGNVLEEGFAGFPTSREFAHAYAEVDALVERGAANCRWSGVCHTGCPFNWYVRRQLGVPHHGRCCGLEPLLSDIAEAVGAGADTRDCAPTRGRRS